MGGGAENQHAAQGATESVNRKISLEELAKHREMDNAWVSMKGKVYDISGWEDHPGRLSFRGIRLHGHRWRSAQLSGYWSIQNMIFIPDCAALTVL